MFHFIYSLGEFLNCKQINSVFHTSTGEEFAWQENKLKDETYLKGNTCTWETGKNAVMQVFSSKECFRKSSTSRVVD